jgi:cell division protein FtsB
MDAGRNKHDEPVASGVPGELRQTRWWGTPSINLGARQPISHSIMFYILTLAAMVIFAPCVLVPVWRDVQKLYEDERTMAGVVAQLRRQIDRNNERITALQSDPQVIDRVARRELNRQAADEQYILWTSAELAAVRGGTTREADPMPEVPPAALPVWMETAGHWLPAWASSDLFAKSPNREMMLVMAASLLLAAFVLYTPKAEARIDTQG